MDRRLVLLAPDDNCVVVAQPLAADDSVEIDGVRFVVGNAIAMGHKLARRSIARGETVLKYGAAIGHATVPVAPGDHLHTHNLASDYIPTANAATPAAQALQ